MTSVQNNTLDLDGSVLPVAEPIHRAACPGVSSFSTGCFWLCYAAGFWGLSAFLLSSIDSPRACVLCSRHVAVGRSYRGWTSAAAAAAATATATPAAAAAAAAT